ncbi:type I restriction enzyme HsdR N-terminal domain-containing protein [Tenacibaculum ovolyticum]|uniref:type I restriction enzyme HsdR N-terminal domain-containing protein n=1 Tax=Tenacibaculum ovolyticum TaxID=104270 RepID=UPI0022F3832A|nr:type I restriction enzyme HsdR N-terminal domain-containing protein [Tenacibaculum ovolyticum]WBX75317.1 type I restriction enzyme HsdR N-terminal domain-containing protein [Tenacibaculum ovolyticum]
MFKNEEDIRGKLILPFLRDLGFDDSEISLERGFKIQLGKNQYKTGRSDILCKRQNKNLFVVELKTDSISITEKDIKQGISYARALLDDIAPFTIVTNGKQTKIFDSISSDELTGTNISDQSSFWKNGYTLSTDEELKIRYEALKNFVSLSPENLKRFCQSQVQDRMGPIIGNIDNPYSKFVKELHFNRKELQTNFKKFIDSDNSVFGLVGTAGVGKTSAICSLALQKLEDKFVFFYNASIINSPLECISKDINIAFSSNSGADIVLKKLDEIGRYANKDILIFIDALDESTNNNISIELSEIALVVKNLDKIKIIVSCKSNIWNSILKSSNSPTHLFEELNKFHKPIASLNNNPGFLLNDFTDVELKAVVPLYQKTFDFKGTLSSTLLKELKNGFFLRIFSEVYSKKEIPKKINDKELIKKYLEKSLLKTKIGKLKGTRVLKEIGKVLLNHEFSSNESNKDEGLNIDSILENLDFALDENLPEDLFSRNILIKSNKDDSYNISFYYSKIRDYVICFHTYKLDKLDDTQFYNILDNFYQNYIGISALDFYINNSNSSQKIILERYKKDKALNYVIGYENYLDNNFERYKDKFDPETNGNIGIILPYNLIENSGYSLLPVDLKKENRLQFHSSKKTDFFEDLYLKRGVMKAFGSNTSLFVSNQDRIIKKNIFEQLKEIIEKGKINTYNSDILIKEKISLILYYYHEKLGFNFQINEYRFPRFNVLYPIDLEDLLIRINKFRFKEHYKYEGVDNRLIKAKVENAIEQKLEAPKYRFTGDAAPFEELYKIASILIKKGHTTIEEHYLPLPDRSIDFAKKYYEQNRKDNFFHTRVAQFSENQAKIYIQEFFRKLETCYKEFVDSNFPTFKNKFDFYNSIPNEYFFYYKESDIFKCHTYGFRTSSTNEFKVNFKSSNNPFEDAFKQDNLESLRSFSQDFILKIYHSWNIVKTVDKFNTSDVDEFCVIRNWLYKFLSDDLKKFFKENEV